MGAFAFLGFVPTWAWKFIGIGLAFVAVYGYADRKATYRERAACEAAAQRAQKAADAQDVKAAVEQRDQALSTADQLKTQKAQDELTIANLKTTLAGKPLNAPCYYPDVAPTGRVRHVPPKPVKGASH